MSHSITKMNTQSGAALFVSLVFLLVLTMLGVSSMKSTVLNEKMVSNLNDSNRSFQASEAALRVAEDWLQGLSLEPEDSTTPTTAQVWSSMEAGEDPDGVGTDCSGNDTVWWQQCNSMWWIANAIQPALALENITNAPYYIIEKQERISDSLNIGKSKDKTGITYYRITSRGTGGSNLTVVKTQSYFAKRF